MDRLDDKTLKIILENSADSVVVTDEQGVIEYVNSAFTDITGYSFDEAVGKTPRILKSGEHDADFYQDLWNKILSGEQARVIFTNKRKSGELYFHEEIITPIKENEQVSGFVSNGRDVTEIISKKKNLEEYCQFIDAVFETLASQTAAYKLLKDVKHKL